MDNANDGATVLEVLGSGLFGAVVVFILGLFVLAKERAARIRGNWSALFVEVSECGRIAEDYPTAKVGAPLYRLPTTSFETCYPALLSDAALDDNNANIILRFFTEVETLNRGLDLADEMFRTNDNRLQAVFARNCLKANQIKSPDGQLYAPAIDLCRRKKTEAGVAQLRRRYSRAANP